MLNQRLQQKLLQKLSPQQIQVIKLLEIPVMMLDQRIKQEIEENPALESGDDEPQIDETPMDSDDEPESDELPNDDEQGESEDEVIEKDEDYSLDEYFDEDEYSNYKYNANNNSPDQDNKEIPFSNGNTFQEFLESQLGLHGLKEEQRILAQYLIGNIDEDGYLRRDMESIVDDIGFKQGITTNEKELESVLEIIHKLDPPGVGCRDLQECLLLQLERLDQKKSTVSIAERIIRNCFVEFTKKHYDKICAKLDIGQATLKLAMNEILHLNPKPGSSYNDPLSKEGASQTIVPDFILDEIGCHLFRRG